MRKNYTSPLAKARDKWLESLEGRSCLDKSILLMPESLQYLKNRLERAFAAGAIAQEEIEKKVTK